MIDVTLPAVTISLPDYPAPPTIDTGALALVVAKLIPPPPAIDMAALAAAVAVILAPPVVVTPPSTAPILKIVWAQNGVTPLLPQDYSYVETDLHKDSVDGGDGNPMCIKCTVTGPWGAFQPSHNNGDVTDWTGVKAVVVSVKSPAVGVPYSMFFLKGGDKPIVGSGVTFTSTKANEWERWSFDPSLLFLDHSTNPPNDCTKIVYKGDIQLKTGAAGTFLVDNWGGV